MRILRRASFGAITLQLVFGSPVAVVAGPAPSSPVAEARLPSQAAQGSLLSPEEIADLSARCEALNNVDLQQVADTPGNVVATMVVRDRMATPQEKIMFVKRGHVQGNPTPALERFPVHCRVEGYVTPSVKFAFLLPPPGKWNERFMLAACDAWCGRVGDDIMVPGLNAGFATITNDGGHYGRAPFDGIWAHQNVQARIDFAHRANHVSAQVGKALLKAFYGKQQRFSYINGFSKGGNAGLMAAQRYPEDFDGVIVKAPVVKYNATNAARFPWVAKAVHPDGKNAILYSDKLPLLHAAVTKACDMIDGLKDGIIDDPRKCHFDPAPLLCKAGQSEDRNECLNQPQVDAVRKFYVRPHTASGEVYFNYATDPGSEHDWARGLLPVKGSKEPGVPFALNGAITGIRYLVLKDNPGANYDWMSFDFVKEKDKIDEMARIFDPDAVDLSAFKARGGKMIIVHGWGDALITANMTIDWFDRVLAHMGKSAVDEFAQLYLIPGADHGSGGTGPYVYDAQSALQAWVEQGVAPKAMVLSDGPSEKTARTRPVFPYPAVARYKGKGDPNVASSFVRIEATSAK